ncbi:MAG: hypothetical protein PHS93_00040 [Candidatus Omnitrophica bacterium]|nr:hypothetical protein [Candidatus Omnitrophota bacterium]MDD5351551.1 hypothetical protein [Candidatus Omnitrophota bacterium]MDD5550986.1 hypothetical protein [Candidatus Omnitrophota bacterium]
MNKQNKTIGNMNIKQGDKNCPHFKSLKNLFKNIIGQSSVIEYAFVIVVIIVALIAMQSYLKRGIQGKIRESADSIGSQYEPGATESDFTITTSSDITSTSLVDVDRTANRVNATTIVTTNMDEQSRTGTETVGAF